MGPGLLSVTIGSSCCVVDPMGARNAERPDPRFARHGTSAAEAGGMTGAADAERATKAHVADPAGRDRAVRDHEQAALIERLSAIREQLLEVAEG